MTDQTSTADQAIKTPVFKGSLVRTVVIGLLIISLIPVLIVGTTFYLRTQQSLLLQTKSQIDTISQNYAEQLSNLASTRLKALNDLNNTQNFDQNLLSIYAGSSDPNYNSALKVIIDYMNGYITTPTEKIFDQLSIVDSAGTVLVSSNRSLVGKSLTEDFFIKSLYQTDQNALTYNPGGLFPDKLVLVTTKIYRNPLGAPGLTIIGFSTPSLLSDLLTTSQSIFDSAHPFYVTANKADVTADASSAKIVQESLTSEYQDQINQYSLLSGSGSSFQYKDQQGRAVLSYIKKIPEVKSTFVYEVPEFTIYGQLQTLLPFILAILAGSLVLIGLAVGLSTRSLVIPLVELARHARDFAGGDWSYRAKVNRIDEIGLLASSFNTMVDQLTTYTHSLEQKVEDRTRQIRLATEVAQQAVTASSRNEILQKTAELITEKFDIPFAAIYLLDDAGQNAVLSEDSARGVVNPLPRSLRVPVNDNSTLGWVAKNNQVRLQRNISSTSNASSQSYLLPETQCEIILPIVLADLVIGVLDLQSTDPAAFDTETSSIFNALINQIVAGLRNIQLLETTQGNLQEATTLYRSSRQITAAQTQNEIEDLITNVLGQTNYVSFFLDVETDTLKLITLSDPQGTRLDQTLKGFTLPFAKAISKLAEGGVIYIDSFVKASDYNNLIAYFERRGCLSAVLIPIFEGKKLAHVLALGSRENIPLSNTPLQPMVNLAEAIGTTMERIHLQMDLNHRMTELSTLASVSEITSTENVEIEYICARLHDQVKKAIGEDVGFAVAVNHESENLVEVPYYHDLEPVLITPYSYSNDLFSTTILDRKSSIYKDVSILGLRPVDSPEISLSTRSWLSVPLVSSGETIGLIALFDSKRSDRFTDLDRELLETIAPQIGSSFRSLILLSAQQKALSAYDQERFLLNSLLENTPDRVTFKDINGDFIRVSRSTENEQSIEANSTSTDEESEESERLVQDPDLEIMATNQPVLGEISQRMSGTGNIWELTSKIPLVNEEGTVTGLLSISRNITDLKNAEQLAERRAGQLLTAAEIAKETSTGSLEINDTLRRLVELVRSRFGFYHSSIFLLDSSRQYAVLRESTGQAGEMLKQAGHKLAVGSQSIIGQTTQKARPVVVNDVTKEQDYYPNPLLPDTRSELGIPLLISGHVIGALDVQSTEYFAFSEEDVRILQVLSDQLAVAIQNANLFTKTEQTLSRHRLLHQITSAAGQSPTIEDAIRAAVQTLHMTMAEDQIAYFAPDSQGFLTISAFAGLSSIEFASTRLAPGEKAAGLAAVERRAIRIDDATQRPEYIPLDPGSKSILAVPVQYRDRLIGVLNVENAEVAAYDENDQEIITTLSNNLASIIANIQLVDQVRLQVERQQQLYDITSKIRRSVDVETIMKTSVAEICSALNIKRATIEITGVANEEFPDTRLHTRPLNKEKK